MIKAIALDDEPPALRVISTFCKQTDFIDLKHTFTKTEDAFNYINAEPVDLIFLDINMPSISGLDFYQRLEKKTMVIFTTAYGEYAVEGFNLQAIDYLLKPFTFQRFLQAVIKAKEYLGFLNQSKIDNKGNIFFRVDYGIIKVAISDITYIEGLNDYLKIHLNQQKPLVIRMTMKGIMEKLPEDFIRIHRSYIISFKHIKSVRNKVVTIAGQELPISNSYEKDFFDKFLI